MPEGALCSRLIVRCEYQGYGEREGTLALAAHRAFEASKAGAGTKHHQRIYLSMGVVLEASKKLFSRILRYNNIMSTQVRDVGANDSFHNFSIWPRPKPKAA